MHVPHVHFSSPDTEGAFIPAAPQLKLVTFGAGRAAPGRAASQTVHFSLAESGFCSMHMLHVQVPPAGAEGAFIPAAPQLNPFIFDAGGVVPGRVASQTVHVSFAESVF